MGLGDEIMALGRAETEYERTGKPVMICTAMGHPRQHPAWDGHPAVVQTFDEQAGKIIDGGGARPYIREWVGNQIIFNMDYRARAGRVVFDDQYRWVRPLGAYAIVAPTIKENASPNKSWGALRWEEAIDGFPIPVYQLCQSDAEAPIRGAIRIVTPTFRAALGLIESAALVLCNEGGTHHMAASMGTPAVVVFGAFVPPQVTGYDFHHNIAVETPEGYCGKWTACEHCQKAMAQITPDMVKQKAVGALELRHAK